MIPATLDLPIYKGIVFGPVVILCQDAAGNPVDLTGWTPYAEARSSPWNCLVFDLAPTIPVGTDGKVYLGKTAVQTNRLTAGSFNWDLIFQNADGERVGPLVAGHISVMLLNTQPAF